MGIDVTDDSGTMPRLVLFLCSGNHYRSRFCEEYFNHQAAVEPTWRSVSRALCKSPSAMNRGPMSPFAIEFLRRRGIRAANPVRLPLEVTDFDLRLTDLVIAVYEPEHRPMIEKGWT